jgi:glutamate-1-semialdehyde 2,1-aminomutase
MTAVSPTASRLDSVLRDLSREYTDSHPESSIVFARACGVLPGGETRAVTTYAPFPVVLERGEGSTLVDVDGHRYLDLVNNYTSLVHGNAYGPVIDAVAERLSGGTCFASPRREQLDLAEVILERLGHGERIRYTNSGSEASVLAARIAFRVTGRATVVALEGAYHGALPPFAEPNPAIVRVALGDLDAMDDALRAGDVAAVFVESFIGAGGVIPISADYLRAVQALCRRYGTLFVVDEIQSFRNAYSGLQGEYGLEPDLILLGKIIGGGFAVGAVVGSQKVMSVTDSSQPGALPHAGTFNGHMPAMVAGLVTLQHFDRGAVDELNARCAAFAESIEQAAERNGVPAVVNRVGSIMNVHFASEAPTTPVPTPWHPALALLHLSLLQYGVYTTPRGMINVSTVTTTAELAAATLAYDRAFELIAGSQL